MRLILIRHGEPNYDKDCLTEEGNRQAEKTAERLKRENISQIYSSPMGRAMETAAYTADALSLPVKQLDFMHEIDWGFSKDHEVPTQNDLESEGHPWSLSYRLLTENPSYIGSENWNMHPFFAQNTCLAEYRKVSDGVDGFMEELGYLRDEGAYFCQKENSRTIALFAHGGSGAVLLSRLFSLPFPFVLTSLPYGLCSVSIIGFYGKTSEMILPCMELFNDMAHVN